MHRQPEPHGDDDWIIAHPALRLRLRRWCSDDVAGLARAANFPDIARWLRDRFPNPYSEDDARYFLGSVVPASTGALHAIEVEGEVAGGIGIEPGNDVYRIGGELGYWLTPSRWRQGVMRQVLADYVPRQAARLQLRRVFARVYAGNVASIRLLERSGFIFEGVQRNAVIKHGEVLDVSVHARVFEHQD